MNVTLKRLAKNVTSDTCGDLINIGKGMHARVYEHPYNSKMVIKVTTNNDAWVKYAKHIVSLKRRKTWMPKIYSMTRANGYVVAEIEKLHSTIKESKLKSRPIDGLDWNKVSNYFYDAKHYKNNLDNCLKVYEIDKLIKENKLTKRFANDIFKLRNNKIFISSYPDLHSDNAMYRKIGDKLTIVITDPFT